MAGDESTATLKRKLEEKDRKLEEKDKKIAKIEKLCSHLLANAYQQAEKKQTKSIKGNAIRLLVHLARRKCSDSFSSRLPVMYPNLQGETKAYLQGIANLIYTQLSKVLTPNVLLAIRPEGKILKHNGSEDEDASEQAEVLKQGYRFLNHNITQARSKQLGEMRGIFSGKLNNQFGR